MGEYAELAIEREIYFRVPARKSLKAVDLSVWRCKDGRSVKLTDMILSHLENTIRMLQRKAPERYAAQIAAMQAELESRSKSQNN
jgi:hypothetical protein